MVFKNTLVLAAVVSLGLLAQARAEVSPERVVTGLGATEGPVAGPEGGLYFTDLEADRIYRLDPAGTLSVVKEPSGRANGLARDKVGRLVVCEQANGRVVRLEEGGDVTVLAAGYEGRRFRHPNDVLVAPDESLYFTDPPPWRASRSERFSGAVYRVDPEGLVTRVAEGLRHPNGLWMDARRRRLYVGDTYGHALWVYPLHEDGGLGEGSVFATLRHPDGMTGDEAGNLYVAQWGHGQLSIFSPEGKKLGILSFPEAQVRNCAFAGLEPDKLWVTAGQSVYVTSVRLHETRSNTNVG